MDLKVGDSVDVPGGMYGTVKFIGPVQGKKGTFAGVDLHQPFWARGKNNGSVDGKNYFRSSKPTSGIFLPLEKAVKRSTPATPTTSGLSSFNVGGRTPSSGKTTFSQSIGPGARAVSPALKPALRRPSLPRPGSPSRQQPGGLTTPSRPSVAGLTKSKIGNGPRLTPGVKSFTPSASLKNGPSTPSNQALDYEPAFDESPAADSTPTPTPIGVAKTMDDIAQQGENKRLKTQLEEKDRQLREQAAALAEMEKTVTELQNFLPADGQAAQQSHHVGNEPADVAHLRALLREKNDKIAVLTAEFDAHRADFRSTIDTLEMASTETERVYEKRVDELLQEIRELQDRGEDVQTVAMQLKQLEELVQELEEGLEDARRGEAEARGEVEHLRGEVERGRTELKHEREKTTHALKVGNTTSTRDARYTKELEAKDDEIRGLKAIIHSFNQEPVRSPGSARKVAAVNGNAGDGLDKELPEPATQLERQVKELQDMIERKANREEELERELERLRTTLILEGPDAKAVGGSNRLSDRTVVPVDWRNTNGSRKALETIEDAVSEVSKVSSTLRCELCEEQGHDILNCTNVFSSRPTATKENAGSLRTGRDVVAEGLKNLAPPSKLSEDETDTVRPLSPRKSPAAYGQPSGEFSAADHTPVKAVPTASKAAADEEKWCAVCDSEEHNTMECPYEDTM